MGVGVAWVVHETFTKDPKVAARIERACARGYKVEIDPSPPERRLIFFGAVPEDEPDQNEEEDTRRPSDSVHAKFAELPF
jgi:hypothetical protein